MLKSRSNFFRVMVTLLRERSDVAAVAPTMGQERCSESVPKGPNAQLNGTGQHLPFGPPVLGEFRFAAGNGHDSPAEQVE